MPPKTRMSLQCTATTSLPKLLFFTSAASLYKQKLGNGVCMLLSRPSVMQSEATSVYACVCLYSPVQHLCSLCKILPFLFAGLQGREELQICKVDCLLRFCECFFIHLVFILKCFVIYNLFLDLIWLSSLLVWFAIVLHLSTLSNKYTHTCLLMRTQTHI